MSDKKSKKMYTDKDFSKDLKDLEKMIKQTKSKQRGGLPGNNASNEPLNNNVNATWRGWFDENDNESDAGSESGSESGSDAGSDAGSEANEGMNMREVMNANVGKNNNPNQPDLGPNIHQAQGGAGESDEGLRRFKIASVDGKPVVLTGRITIKSHQTPLSAAKKLLRSYAKHHGLTENGKTKLKIVYTIQETTQGSKKKVYGPYEGKYYKYNKEEAEKAKASGISFKFKPMVKLHKGTKTGGVRS